MAAALTNCAMMSIPPSEAKALTWWEYGALLAEWNERHKDPNAPEPLAAPDPEMVARSQARLEARGLVKVLH